MVKGPLSPTRSSQLEGEGCHRKLWSHVTGSEMEAGRGAEGVEGRREAGLSRGTMTGTE